MVKTFNVVVKPEEERVGANIELKMVSPPLSVGGQGSSEELSSIKGFK
jgi:hypothetical protein